MLICLLLLNKWGRKLCYCYMKRKGFFCGNGNSFPIAMATQHHGSNNHQLPQKNALMKPASKDAIFGGVLRCCAVKNDIPEFVLTGVV